MAFELFTHVTRFLGLKVVLLGLYNGQRLQQEPPQDIVTYARVTEVGCLPPPCLPTSHPVSWLCLHSAPARLPSAVLPQGPAGFGCFTLAFGCCLP